MLRYALLAFVVASGACTSPAIDDTSLAVGMYPRTAYSGYNANATFTVLFSTNAADAHWSLTDPSIATIEPTTPPVVAGVDINSLYYVKLTMKKAGTTKVMLDAQGTTMSADLIVKAYADDQLALGKARYEVGTPADGNRPPCAGCHQKAGGVDHSPLKMAGFDDTTILGVIQNATYSANSSGTSSNGAYSPRGPLSFTGHKWNLTDAEKDAIVCYLRSLPLGAASPSTDAGAE